LGSENNLINSKLLKEQEIIEYLGTVFKEKKINPYDDRNEIEEKIEQDPNGFTYEEATDEAAQNDIMHEEDTEEKKEELIDFEFENETVDNTNQ